MNFSLIEILAAGSATLAVLMCGITSLKAQLQALACQTALFAGICVLVGIQQHAEHFLILALVIFLLKAIGIPLFLGWSSQRMGIQRDTGVTLNPGITLMMGFGALLAGYFLTPQFAVQSAGNPICAGISLALLFIGMLLMITRRLAISQVVGFLVMENGIFLYGLTQTHGMPHLVEMAAIFEVLIAVLIAGLVIFRINRSFEHIDVSKMRTLRH